MHCCVSRVLRSNKKWPVEQEERPWQCPSLPTGEPASVACPLTLLRLLAAPDNAQPVVGARRLPGSGLRNRLVCPEEPCEDAALVQAATGPSGATSAGRQAGGGSGCS
jgi:hypothetical protein